MHEVFYVSCSPARNVEFDEIDARAGQRELNSNSTSDRERMRQRVEASTARHISIDRDEIETANVVIET